MEESGVEDKKKCKNIILEELSKATHADLATLVERAIDPFGRFQKFVLITMCLNSLIVGSNHTLTTYHSYTPENYTCVDPGFETFENQTCVPGCVEYEFSDTGTSVVTEWNLVCDKRYLSAMINTIYFAGVTIGSLVCGILADKWGRRKLVLTCLYLQGIIGASAYFMTKLETFMMLRSMQGFFIQGLHGVSYTLMQELTPPRKLTISGLSWELMWTFGLIFVGTIAYFITDWKMLQIALAVPTVASLAWFWLLPESPKWHLANDDKVSALHGALRIADRNKDEEFFDECNKLRYKNSKSEIPITKEPHTTARMVDLVVHRILLKHTLVMIAVWFSITLAYFGILLYMPNLPGGRHFNFIAGGVIEIAACFVAYFALSSFLGRRYSMILFQYLTAMFCLVLGLLIFFEDVSGDWTTYTTAAVAVIGKACAGAAFVGMFIYGAELFPTVLRGSAIGICGFAARAGSLLAPQVILLGEVTHPIIPMLMMVVGLIVSATATFAVPETLNKVLPNTLKDVDLVWNNSNKKR